MYGKILQDKSQDTTLWFYFTIVFLLVDYGRPQDLIPIGILRPGLLSMLCLTILIFKYKGLASSKSNQLRMIWFFTFLLALYIPFARNGHYAYQTFVTIIKFMPFIISVVVCVNSVDRLKVFMRFYIGVMIYVSLYGLTHNGIGSGNYFADENDISLYINMVLPFCYFLFMAEKNKKAKWMYAAGLLIGLLTVVVSFSRGGFVGLVVMFVIVWFVSPKKMLSLFLICLLAGVGYMFSDDSYKQEMTTVTDTEDSTANARLMSWASGWDMFVDNPLGVGGNNFQVLFPEYQAGRFKRGMWGRVAHSLWFTLIPELGIVGIILYFRLLGYNLKDIFSIKLKKPDLSDNEKYLNAMSIAFLASLAGFFASATFLSVLYYPHYWYVTAVIVATARIQRARLSTKKEA